jgi:hypothetical protein
MVSRFPCDISHRLQELVETPLRPSDVGGPGYQESLLCRTNWVEILLLRFAKNPEILRIEVEVFMPVAAQPQEHLIPQKKVPLDMIAHMEYLIGLLDVGFSLQVFGEECLWVASKQFKGIPRLDAVRKLVPPSTE